MKYVIFEKNACERYEWSPLLAIGNKLKEENHEVEYFSPPYFDIEKGDIPLTPEKEINGIFAYKMYTPEISKYYTGKTDVFLSDWGFLKRKKGYYYLIKNHQYPEGNKGDKFKKLNLRMTPNWNKDGHILVCLQDHHAEWYKTTIENLRVFAKKGREIRLRYPKYVDPSKKKIGEANYSTGKPLKEDLKGAYSLVTCNSTALYEGLLNCIPVFCSEKCVVATHKQAIESKVISTKMFDIEKIKDIIDPSQFLFDAAYAQYTLKELREGSFLNLLV